MVFPKHLFGTINNELEILDKNDTKELNIDNNEKTEDVNIDINEEIEIYDFNDNKVELEFNDHIEDIVIHE